MKENEKPKQVVELIEDDTPEFLTCRQLADKLDVSTKTIQRWVRRRVIPVIKIGRKIFFDWDDISKSLKKQSRRI